MFKVVKSMPLFKYDTLLDTHVAVTTRGDIHSHNMADFLVVRTYVNNLLASEVLEFIPEVAVRIWRI